MSPELCRDSHVYEFSKGENMKQRIHLPRIARIAAVYVFGAASLASAFAQTAASDAAARNEARNQEIWREAISQTEVPAVGCFHASYPSLAWGKIECTVAPNIPYTPRTGRLSQTVGDGDDYAAEVTSGLIKKTVGSFPKVTGVTSETGVGGANDYSLQLNSNFMNTAACDGAKVPAKCLDWEQFVYASGYDVAFMQYWLINWNTTCPTGWFKYSTDCYTNSAGVTAPQEVITKLKTLRLSGAAKKGGLDTLVFTVGTEAYSTTGEDSVVDLATAWTESEFNIIGDGGGSEANFNEGASVTVKVAVTNGTKNAPTCAADSGTTGETNNLNLGSCTGTGGSAPYIEFVESN
jgi:hypothetical protein